MINLYEGTTRSMIEAAASSDSSQARDPAQAWDHLTGSGINVSHVMFVRAHRRETQVVVDEARERAFAFAGGTCYLHPGCQLVETWYCQSSVQRLP